MMKRKERSWMYDRLVGRNLKPEFLKGVEEFMEHCKQNPESTNENEVRCPCFKCKNRRLYNAATVKEHLHKQGFIPGYYDWHCHGESITEATLAPWDPPSRKLVIKAPKNNQEPLAKAPKGKQSVVEEEPNAEANQLFDLLKAAEKPLYDGSTMSLLEMASKLTSLTCEYNLPHKCFDEFASLLNEVIPNKNNNNNDNNMTKVFFDTKKVVKGLELPHEKIHACPKGCMLFWKGDAHLDKCRVCESYRYRKTSKGALVPSKVLIYFPITPRLQRLFATKMISEDMTWHSKKPRVQNTMAHPRDSEAWKHLDRTFPDFASEPRNVRLGMCTDGFAPHGKFGGQYSCWPIILTPYNLPPSLCMKKPFMFLSLLIPGPKNPRRSLDVYMQPLVEELKQLWENGATTYDISKKQNFNLRAAILWTISDFSAYEMLSGWSTTGKKACPYCLDKSKAFWLDHGGTVSWFDCHRQFLSPNHPFRKNKRAFCKNRVEKNSPPPIMSGEKLWRHVKDMPKATDGPEELKRIKKAKKGWFKQSILWELPYWKNLLIRHNLDVMHIEKSFFDQLINTVMDVKRHTSDTIIARKDMAHVCNRTQLELTVDDRGKESMPKAPFTLDKDEKKVLCEWVRDLRFPDGYASNLSRCADLQTCKLRGMKYHDCHVFMERLLPVALKELLPVHVWKPITEISQFFRDLCSSTIKVSDMERLEQNIAEILCKLEKTFPPAFFNIMEHLPVHLPYEAKVGGPIQYRWMYPFVRFLNRLKHNVGNKACVEGLLCNAYLNEEIANFCSLYFQSKVDTKAQDLGKNVKPDGERNILDKDVPELFNVDRGCAPNEGNRRFLEDVEYKHAHLYVLANCGIIGDYEKRFEEHIARTRPGITLEDIWEKHEAEFAEWFKSQVLRSMTTSDVMRALAMGPCKQARTWSQFSVNGYNFQTYEYCKYKSTMNYGVCVYNQDGAEFGILDDVIELVYTGNLGVYKTKLFKCNWMDAEKGVNIHEHYKLVEVNHRSKNPKYDPFVLPHQACQVYFTPYPSVKKDRAQWWAVFNTKAKSMVDASVDLDIFQEATIVTPSTLCAPDEVPDYSGEEGIPQDEDDGVEGMLVDAEEEGDDNESSCDSSDDSSDDVVDDSDDEDDDPDLFC